MSNLGSLLTLPLAIFGFLFLFWQRLREDYSAEKIFSAAILTLGLILIGFFLGYRGLWFWLSFIFGSIGFFIAYHKHNLRFFETFEAATISFLFWLFCVSIGKNLIFSIFLLILLGLYHILNTRYKSFTWYKSGKVGFSGLIVLGIFFLGRTFIAFIHPSMVSFVGKIDAIPSIALSLIFFIALVKLGEL